MLNRTLTFRKINFLAALTLVVASLVFGTSAWADSFVVTNPPSMQKVPPTTGGAGPRAKILRIAMARGEYEPVQIVVHAADKPLRRVRVSVSSLVGPNGSTLPQKQITVTPMGYITCKLSMPWPRLSKDKGDKVEIPDVLLPDRPMDVPKGRRQPYYITVHTLRSDQAGEYRGTVRISAAGEETREIPLLVRVYDIVLPVKSHLRTSFGLDVSYRKIKGADPGQDLESLLRYSKFMLEYRISPCVLGSGRENTRVPPLKGKDGKLDFSGTDRFLSELVPLGLTSFRVITGMYDQEQVQQVKTSAEYLKEHGWWDLSYVYAFDEAKMGVLPRMQKWYGALVKAVPDVKILQVGWASPTKPLEGLVNIWCPILNLADMSALQKARERGEEVWWYTIGWPGRPYPNISSIDYAGVYARIAGWMSYHYRIEGFLYFAVDIWDTNPLTPPGGRLSVDEYDRANYANWEPNTYTGDSTGEKPHNGLGYLFYPGKGNTPIASMRLAMTRDGFEDYDLFKEVEALTAGDDKAAERAQKVLDFSRPFERPIITDYVKWTKTDNVLMRRREAILMMAEELRRPDDPQLKALRKQVGLKTLYPLSPRRE